MNGKRGGQAGNQNARKHGFYSKMLTEEEKADLENAVLVEGIDEEIALLRVKIKSLMKYDPENVRLLAQAVNALSRLVAAKSDVGSDDKTGLARAVANVLRDIALPMAISIGSGLGRLAK